MGLFDAIKHNGSGLGRRLLKAAGLGHGAPLSIAKAAALRKKLLCEPNRSAQEICAILDHDRPKPAGYEDIYFLFRHILGRRLNPEEMSGHMGMAGQDLVDLVKQYLGSREFDLRDMLAPIETSIALVERNGYSLYVDPLDQAVGKYVAAGGYESNVTAFFERSLQPGDTVVDIGANMGYFTMLAAHLVGSAGCVVAVEPNVNNCRMLEASRKHNGFQHVTVLGVAASDHNDILTLNTSYSNGTVAENVESVATLMRSTIVPAVRLDDVIHVDRIDLVKIDVEGYEHVAMSGFGDCISRFRPTVVSEFTPTGMTHDPMVYLDFYLERNYRLSVLGIAGHLSPCESAAAVMNIWERSGLSHIDIVATPG